MFTKSDIAIERADWQTILADYDMEALISFMNKIYSLLTQKKVTKPPLANYMTSKDY